MQGARGVKLRVFDCPRQVGAAKGESQGEKSGMDVIKGLLHHKTSDCCALGIAAAGPAGARRLQQRRGMPAAQGARYRVGEPCGEATDSK